MNTIQHHCIQSELQYSLALGARAEEFGSCLAVVNPHNPLQGDYNRVFVRHAAEPDALAQDIAAAQGHYAALAIPPFDHVELFPGVEAGFVEALETVGYSTREHSFYAAHQVIPVDTELGDLQTPTMSEYMARYEKRCRGYEDFEEEWWRFEKDDRPAYARTFEPLWFYVDGQHIGYMDCAELGDFTCIHDVTIDPAFRGNGYGLEMVFRAIQAKQKPVVGSIARSLQPFYEKLGFEFACATHVMTLPEAT